MEKWQTQMAELVNSTDLFCVMGWMFWRTVLTSESNWEWWDLQLAKHKLWMHGWLSTYSEWGNYSWERIMNLGKVKCRNLYACSRIWDWAAHWCFCLLGGRANDFRRSSLCHAAQWNCFLRISQLVWKLGSERRVNHDTAVSLKQTGNDETCNGLL